MLRIVNFTLLSLLFGVKYSFGEMSVEAFYRSYKLENIKIIAGGYFAGERI